MARNEYSETSRPELHIVEVREDGMVVHLDDGSRWNVSVGDNTKSMCWYPTMRVVVEETDSALYPFTLTNLETAGPDVVRVSRQIATHA